MAGFCWPEVNRKTLPDRVMYIAPLLRFGGRPPTRSAFQNSKASKAKKQNRPFAIAHGLFKMPPAGIFKTELMGWKKAGSGKRKIGARLRPKANALFPAQWALLIWVFWRCSWCVPVLVLRSAGIIRGFFCRLGLSWRKPSKPGNGESKQWSAFNIDARAENLTAEKSFRFLARNGCENFCVSPGRS